MIFRFACVSFALVAQTLAQQQCYTLGVTAPIPAPTTYRKCPGSSMCCRTNDDNADTCATESNLVGLCRSRNFDLWRESCTDQRWKDGGCLQLCLDPYVGPNNVTINRAATDYIITQCEDGSLCCGTRGSDEYGECCREKRGVWLDNLKVVSTKPVYTSMSSIFASSTASSTASSSSSSSQSVPPSTDSQSHTGAIVGGVVGGVTAIFAIVLGLYLIRRHGKHNTTTKSEMEDTGIAPTEKYAMHSELPYHDRQVPNELHGSPDPVELGDHR